MITITVGKPNDAEALAELFVEMDHFYGEEAVESVGDKIRQINSTLFASNPLAYTFLAWDQGQLAGMAAYSFLWPAALTTKSLYLKELYVRQDRRRSGIGRLLIQHIFKYAVDNECSRVEWTTDQSNAEAQCFYEALGVTANSSKIFYRADV